MKKVKLITVTEPKILEYEYHGKERKIEYVCSECGSKISWKKIVKEKAE